jgi:hypothetical protein
MPCFGTPLLVAFCAHQWHESAALKHFYDWHAIPPANQLQFLRLWRAYGNDHPAAFRKLIKKASRQAGSGSANYDSVEWRVLKQAMTAVSDHDSNIVQTESDQDCFGTPCEAGVAFD